MTQTVVIGGGTGSVGEGIVRAFLEAGFRVIVPSRSETKVAQLADRLRDAPGKIEPIIVDLEDKKSVQTAVRSKVDSVDTLVASLGGWWQGTPLVSVRPETWRKVMGMGLDAHFFFARAFVPLLRRGPGSSYTFINGSSAEHAYSGASLSSISAAAQLMMAQSLMVELKGQHRVNALVLGPVITRSRPHGNHDWITAVDAGNAAVALANNVGADAEVYRLDTVEDLSKVKRVA